MVELMYSNLPWLHSYLEDLIALPVILGCALTAVQIARKRWQSFVIPKRDLVLITIAFAFYFEVVLPKFSDRFTQDPWDALCYVLGAGFFYTFINRPWIQPSTTARSDAERFD